MRFHSVQVEGPQPAAVLMDDSDNNNAGCIETLLLLGGEDEPINIQTHPLLKELTHKAINKAYYLKVGFPLVVVYICLFVFANMSVSPKVLSCLSFLAPSNPMFQSQWDQMTSAFTLCFIALLCYLLNQPTRPHLRSNL